MPLEVRVGPGRFVFVGLGTEGHGRIDRLCNANLSGHATEPVCLRPDQEWDGKAVTTRLVVVNMPQSVQSHAAGKEVTYRPTVRLRSRVHRSASKEDL